MDWSEYGVFWRVMRNTSPDRSQKRPSNNVKAGRAVSAKL